MPAFHGRTIQSLHLEALTRNNPRQSWWLDGERFYDAARSEFDRMRVSRFGNCTHCPGKPGMGTIEMYRAKRAMAGRVAHGA